ncbi:MAG: Gldg family protein [Kofleriaceae bacterium]
MRSARAAYWVMRRELHVMLRAPIMYVVGGVFLAVQGVAFAGLVGVLSDPRRPAPLGALLEQQLAGTLLTWVLSLVVLTLLGMRAIADDKKTGGWELLLTAQVGEGAAVVGKWLAATVIYALLWVPTLAYLVVVALFRSDGGGWDIATVVTGYAGAIAIGAALLAWTVAASAAMGSTLGAGALGFALLVGLFLVGELPALAPDLALERPALAAALSAVSVRAHLAAFARGELGVAPLVFVTSLATLGMSLAITLACAGRRHRRELRARTLGTLLVALVGALALVLAVRHPARIDVSASGRNSLDPGTRAVLANVDRATLTVVRPSLGALDPLYDEVTRVVRLAGEAPGMTVVVVDPVNAPGGLDAVARSAGVLPKDLANGGAVIVDAYGKRRVIDLLSLATIERVDGAASVEQLAVERAVSGALAQMGQTVPIFVCFTTGHGELPFESTEARADWSVVAERLRGDGMSLEEVSLASPVPARCSVLVVAGPSTPFSAEEALVVQQYLATGGGLLVAAPARVVGRGDDRVGRTGLEALLAQSGLGLPRAIAFDPGWTVKEIPGSILVFAGYADHAIDRGFANARPTMWVMPRAVLIEGGARALITASSESWAETSFDARSVERGPDDLAGPIVLAAIGQGERVVAVASAEDFSSVSLAGYASAGDLWLAQALRFLSKAPEPNVDVAARRPDQIRLVMTDGQRRTVIAISVAGIPLAWILVGGAIVLWRRRRS